MKLRQTKGVPVEVIGRGRTTLSGHRDREFGTVREIAAPRSYRSPKRTVAGADGVEAGRGQQPR